MYKKIALVCFTFSALFAGKLSAQPLSVGADFMGNIIHSDFNAHPLYFSGDIYGKFETKYWFSLYIAYTFGTLKMSLDANERAKAHFPEKIFTKYSSGEIFAGFPVLKTSSTLELFFGAEFLHFNPESNDNSPLPATKFSSFVDGFLLGAGFEMPIDEKFSLHARLLVHFPATEYLDDFPSGTSDKFTTFGIGISFPLGTAKTTEPEKPYDRFTDTSKFKKAWNGQTDSDGDGIGDEDEINTYHTDPKNPDSDGDGLTDFQEIFVTRTDPHNRDTDSDGLFDGEEVNKYFTDPLSHDSDGDGYDDGYEANVLHTDPRNRDTDGDGIWDKDDKCPLVKGKAPSGCP